MWLSNGLSIESGTFLAFILFTSGDVNKKSFGDVNKMNKLYIIIAVVVLALIITGGVLMQSKKSFFDITVDPLGSPQSQGENGAYKRNIYDCPTSLAHEGNGLNMQNGGSDFTVCKFAEKFKDLLVYPEQDPYDIVPRQYCGLFYENFHDDFTERWESLGVCEQDVKTELSKCKNAPRLAQSYETTHPTF